MESLSDMWVTTLADESWKHSTERKHRLYPLKWQPVDTTVPPVRLPTIGDVLATERHSDARRLPVKIEAALRMPLNGMTTEQRKRMIEVFSEIDEDYRLVKGRLADDAVAAEWFSRGYDVMPDLKTGKYVWVRTGQSKLSPMSDTKPGLSQLRPDEEEEDEEPKRTNTGAMLYELTREPWRARESGRYPLYWQRLENAEQAEKPMMPLPMMAPELVQRVRDGQSSASLLRDVDVEYIKLKDSLADNSDAARWFQKGFDILPDFDQGRYVWVYTGVEKRSANELRKQPFLFGQLEGDSDDDEPPCDACVGLESLVVDLFHDNKLVKEREAMPLTWTASGTGKTSYTDLLEQAKNWTGITNASSISLFTAERKPAQKIDWFARTLYTRRLVDCEDVRYMQSRYVAIGISSIGYSCMLCKKPALFANTKLMKAFCGEQCHASFLSTIVPSIR